MSNDTTRNFTRKQLMDEWDLPWNREHVIRDEVYGNSRWSIRHDLIFRAPDDGKTYQTSYQVGATESQDESPWEYEDTIEATEVHLVEKLIKVWEPVKAFDAEASQ